MASSKRRLTDQLQAVRDRARQVDQGVDHIEESAPTAGPSLQPLPFPELSKETQEKLFDCYLAHLRANHPKPSRTGSIVRPQDMPEEVYERLWDRCNMIFGIDDYDEWFGALIEDYGYVVVAIKILDIMQDLYVGEDVVPTLAKKAPGRDRSQYRTYSREEVQTSYKRRSVQRERYDSLIKRKRDDEAGEGSSKKMRMEEEGREEGSAAEETSIQEHALVGEIHKIDDIAGEGGDTRDYEAENANEDEVDNAAEDADEV